MVTSAMLYEAAKKVRREGKLYPGAYGGKQSVVDKALRKPVRRCAIGVIYDMPENTFSLCGKGVEFRSYLHDMGAAECENDAFEGSPEARCQYMYGKLLALATMREAEEVAERAGQHAMVGAGVWLDVVYRGMER